MAGPAGKEKELYDAAGKGDVQAIARLLDGPDPPDVNWRKPENHGWTVLHHACHRGDAEAAEALLRHGAEVDARSSSMNTPLHLAARAGHARVVEVLLRHDADFEARANDGQTPLILAAFNGQVDAAALLLRRGANTAAKDNDQRTALDWANKNNKADVVHVLEQHAGKYDGKDLTAVPAEVAGFANVSLRDNQLRAPCLAQLGEQLLDLDLAGNAPFGALEAAALARLTRLRTLSLARCELRGEDVRALGACGALEVLDLSDNGALGDVPAALSDTVRELMLARCGLKAVPACVAGLARLEVLDLSDNGELGDVPDGALSGTVRELRLARCGLKAVPACVARLSQLEVLDLSDNGALGDMPAALNGTIRELRLARCGLKAVPACVAGLAWLRVLDLSDNRGLGDVPDGALSGAVRELRLAQCGLKGVPACVAGLVRLEVLDVSGNAIDALPPELARLEQLRVLERGGCPLRELPQELHAAPLERLREFLTDLAEASTAVFRCKVLLVGYSEVGKTTLLHTLLPPQDALRRASALGRAVGWWSDAECTLRGTQLVVKDAGRGGGEWARELFGVRVFKDTESETRWGVDAGLFTPTDWFECADALGREEWFQAARFLAQSERTVGIDVVARRIPVAELRAALELNEDTCRVPDGGQLEVSVWDFAGQHEYQDGHQLFLTGRAVYVVLWDMTWARRDAALAELRHWLATLRMRLAGSEGVVVYVVGNKADLAASDADRVACLQRAREVALELLGDAVPHRVVKGICARRVADVARLRARLLADLAVLPHLGERVPTAYLKMEALLVKQQRAYRLECLRGTEPAPPVTRLTVLASQFGERGRVARGLELLHEWGNVVYLGRAASASGDAAVGAGGDGTAGAAGDAPAAGAPEESALLRELVVTVPQWLTVKVLGGLVTAYSASFRDRAAREAGQAFDEGVAAAAGADAAGAAVRPEVAHAALKRQAMWQQIDAAGCFGEVLAVLESCELAIAAAGGAASFFPLLLPALPPATHEWPSTPAGEGVRELVQVVRLSGVPMGFHGVLLARLERALRVQGGAVEYGECWRSGTVLRVGGALALVTVHDHVGWVRVCVRAGSAAQRAAVAGLVAGAVQGAVRERYPGVAWGGVFVECVCVAHCAKHKWHWDAALAARLAADAEVARFAAAHGSKEELSRVAWRAVQGAGDDAVPQLFAVAELDEAVRAGSPSVACRRSHAFVSVRRLLTGEEVEVAAGAAAADAAAGCVAGAGAGAAAGGGNAELLAILRRIDLNAEESVKHLNKLREPPPP